MKIFFICSFMLCILFLEAGWLTEDYTELNGKIRSNDVRNVFFYDTKNDPDDSWRWDDQRSWYYEPSFPDDDFLGSTPDPNRWIINDPDEYLNQNNLIHYYKPPTEDVFHSAEYISNWEISGDFEVAIDFELLIWNQSQFQHESSIRLEFWVDENNAGKLWRYRHSDNNYWGQVWINGDFYHGRESSGSGNETIGKLLLNRTGDRLEMWRWSPDDQLYQRVFYKTGFSTASGNIYLVFTNYNTEMEVEVDDFKIISGTTDFGNDGSLTRGLKNEFPEQAILIKTDESLEIIDADDNKLWMRFTGIEDNLGVIGGNTSPLFALNGIIYTTWNQAFQGLVSIDFTNDEVLYISDSYNQVYEGNIRQRNLDERWLSHTPSYSITTDQINSISGANEGSDSYLAFGHDQGACIVKNYNYTFSSAETNPIHTLGFDDDFRFYYADDMVLHQCVSSYKYGNFSHSVGMVCPETQALAFSTEYTFAAGTSETTKFSQDPFLILDSYTAGSGLAPTSSNNCMGLACFGDTLFVGTAGITDGFISAVNITNDTFLFSIDESDGLISNDCAAMSGGETPLFNRNIIWGTENGVTRLYGISGGVCNVQLLMDGNDAELNWTEIIQASIYNIYRDVIPAVEPDPQTYIGSTSNTFYIDYNAGISSDIYFYTVTWED